MKIRTAMTLMTALCALTLTSYAQDNGGPPPDGGQGGPGGPGGGMRHRPPPPIITALDVNHDGIIDSNEIANASAELLTLDKNDDGQLTPGEFRPLRPQNAPDGQTNSEPPGPPGADQGGQGGPGMGHHHPISPVMAALDTNHDGTLEANEIANASTALKTLDKNGDGQLTRDELRPPRPEGGPGGDHGDGGDRPPGPPPGGDGNQ
jgi:EF hand